MTQRMVKRTGPKLAAAVCAVALGPAMATAAQDFEPLIPVGIDITAAVADDSAAVTPLPFADTAVQDISPIAPLPATSFETARCQVANSEPLGTLSRIGDLPPVPSVVRAKDGFCVGSAWRISATDRANNSSLSFAYNPGQAACEDGTCETREFRSRVQLGIDDLSIGSDTASGWFLFAGADDKAVLWRPNGMGRSASNGELLLNDSVTVGDLEAGVSLKSERAELSVSYIRRETSYRISQEEKLTDTSDYVGVVLRMK